VSCLFLCFIASLSFISILFCSTTDGRGVKKLSREEKSYFRGRKNLFSFGVFVMETLFFVMFVQLVAGINM
jgi:hypothetical protein